MRVSVVIPHCPGEKYDALLRKCVASLPRHDELVVVANEIGTIGFTRAVNIGMSLATGDFVVVANNDVEWERGTFDDLCVPGKVTSPVLNGNAQRFWGCMFCVPREAYGKIGPLDERFYLYCSDTDYALRARDAGFGPECAEKCGISSLGGRTTMDMAGRKEADDADTAKFIEKWGIRPDAAMNL